MSQRAQQSVIDAAHVTVDLGSRIPGSIGTIVVTIYSGAYKSVDFMLATVGFQNKDQHDSGLQDEVKELTWQERIWGVKTATVEETV